MKASNKTTAFTMLELLVVTLALVGLVLVLLPIVGNARARPHRISCTNNLKQLNYAFRIWANAHDDKFPMQVPATNGGAQEWAAQGAAHAVFLTMSNELESPKVLICQSDSSRVAATTFSQTVRPGSLGKSIAFTPTNQLSYFVGLNSDVSQPDTIVSGDDNLMIGDVQAKPGLWLLNTNDPVAWTKERHIYNGNVALADGSVQGFNSSALCAALVRTGLATNRLAMP